MILRTVFVLTPWHARLASALVRVSTSHFESMLVAPRPSVPPRVPPCDEGDAECLLQLLRGASALERLALVCTSSGIEAQGVVQHARARGMCTHAIRARVPDAVVASSGVLSTLVTLPGVHRVACERRAVEVLACLCLDWAAHRGAALSHAHLARALQVRLLSEPVMIAPAARAWLGAACRVTAAVAQDFKILR